MSALLLFAWAASAQPLRVAALPQLRAPVLRALPALSPVRFEPAPWSLAPLSPLRAGPDRKGPRPELDAAFDGSRLRGAQPPDARTLSPLYGPRRRAPHSRRHRVEPGARVRLSLRDPDATPGYRKGAKGKARARASLEEEVPRLVELHQRLIADGTKSVLVVLQAMDAAGKDGVIKKVLGRLLPTGLSITSFRKPAGREAEQDFLWRIHSQVPKKGQLGAFNRSHYEDILVPAVEGGPAPGELEARYRQVNDFERYLAENGVAVVKIFLHISREEQGERLRERLRRPEKNWKFDPNDLRVRKKWDRYMAAYEEVLSRTSTPWAPWHVIPADRKWYRDVAVARILREALEGLELRYPVLSDEERDVEID